MRVPLLDLQAQYATVRREVMTAVAGVFETQVFIGGRHLEACEAGVAAYCGCPHAVGLSSGTDALLAALMAEGIGPGDEVITTPYTFFATVGSVWRLGAKPVFVDIDAATCNIDPARIEQAVTPRTRVILPVHLFGCMASMDSIMDIAERHGLVVVEDAAQAIGAECRGRRAGSIGHYGCFSFYPSKNLPGAGDGGMVTTRDAARAQRVRRLRNHGMEPRYYHAVVGGNFRLDALQAAVVRAKLPHLDTWSEARRRNAARYDRLFEARGMVPDPVGLPRPPHPVSAPPPARPSRHVFNQYVIRVPRRDALMEHLKAHQIGCEVYYPVPLHRQACFRDMGHREGDFPGSEQAARETLAIPIYPELTEAAAGCVVDTIAAFYGA